MAGCGCCSNTATAGGVWCDVASAVVLPCIVQTALLVIFTIAAASYCSAAAADLSRPCCSSIVGASVGGRTLYATQHQCLGIGTNMNVTCQIISVSLGPVAPRQHVGARTAHCMVACKRSGGAHRGRQCEEVALYSSAPGRQSRFVSHSSAKHGLQLDTHW